MDRQDREALHHGSAGMGRGDPVSLRHQTRRVERLVVHLLLAIPKEDLRQTLSGPVLRRTMTPSHRFITQLFLSLFVVPAIVHAAELRARLFDQSKKALQKVECRLVNVQTGETTSLSSDKKGEARFDKSKPSKT